MGANGEIGWGRLIGGYWEWGVRWEGCLFEGDVRDFEVAEQGEEGVAKRKEAWRLLGSVELEGA